MLIICGVHIILKFPEPILPKMNIENFKFLLHLYLVRRIHNGKNTLTNFNESRYNSIYIR